MNKSFWSDFDLKTFKISNEYSYGIRIKTICCWDTKCIVKVKKVAKELVFALQSWEN